MAVDGLLLTLYRLLVMPPMILLAILLSPFNKKLRWGLRRRMEASNSPKVASPIWFHCASGEFEYAKPVIRRLKEKDPACKVLVTYYSPSYHKAVEQFPGVDLAIPLPLDLPGPARSFIRRYRPKALLIARSDLWPEILRRARTERIPVLLFSCTRPPLKPWQRFLLPVLRFLYRPLDAVFCVTPEDEKVLREFFPAEKIMVTGDTRFDQVRHRLENPNLLPVNIEKSDRPALICGSVWPEDHEAIFPAWREAVRNRQLRVVVVPHESGLNFINVIKKDLSSAELTFQLLSDADAWHTDVLIVDKPGYLAELYAQADFAFVGGSFRAKVHSVMEPLAAGLITLVGPYHRNNREACTFQRVLLPQVFPRGHGAVIPVQNTDDFRARLNDLIAMQTAKDEAKALIIAEVQNRQGASETVVQWIEQRSLS